MEEGTYQYWSAETDVEITESIVRKMQVEYEQKLPNQNEKPGVKERLAALQELIREFEMAEWTVIERGGKAFRELHPDMIAPEKTLPDLPFPGPPSDAAQPFEVTLDFYIPNQTEIERAGYLEL